MSDLKDLITAAMNRTAFQHGRTQINQFRLVFPAASTDKAQLCTQHARDLACLAGCLSPAQFSCRSDATHDPSGSSRSIMTASPTLLADVQQLDHPNIAANTDGQSTAPEAPYAFESSGDVLELMYTWFIFMYSMSRRPVATAGVSKAAI